MSPEDNTEDLHGRIVRVAKEPKTAPRGGYLFRGVEISRESDQQRGFVIFPVFSGSRIYEFPLLCHEGLRIAAFKLRFNNRLDDGSTIYTVTRKSDLILEPHRPVSVTEAVEAARCVRSVDVRLRVSPDEPFWMAKGKMIHALMEHILRHRCENDDDDFEQAFRNALPSFVSTLPGSGVSVDLEALSEEAKGHFISLRAWLERHHDGPCAVETETERISTRWGMKGRADAVLHHSGHKTILELKTGRATSDQHLLQLYAYALLMGCDEESFPADGCVLYSATGKTDHLTDLGEDARNAIVDGRNRVVALKHSYTLGNDSLDTQFPEVSCNESERCFSRRNCLRLFGSPPGTGGFLRDVEREYYDRWFKLLSIEDWAAEGDFARILDATTLPQRIEEGITLQLNAVRFRDSYQQEAAEEHGADGRSDPGFDTDTYDALAPLGKLIPDRLIGEFSTTRGADSDLQPGEEVMLHTGDPCADNALRGRVIQVCREVTRVSLKVPFSGSGSSDSLRRPPFSSERWFLDRIPFARPRQVARHALFRFFLRADKHVVRAIVHGEDIKGPGKPLSSVAKGTGPEALESNGQSPGRLDDLCYSEGLSAELNEDQQAAIRAAVDCDTFHLIHGPPGTGKTRVLARLIRLCLDRGERILVACPTNVALDRLLVAVMHLGVRRLLRVGGRSTASSEFLEALERLGNPPALLEDLSRGVSDFGNFISVVQGMELIGATAYQCAANPIFLRQRFDRVVLDEAGQLDEPLALAPLTLAPSCVLCGDHLQLPPVVQARTCPQPEEAGLEQSLFERLYRSSPQSKISRLRMQYRMNEEVQAIPSRLFYDGALFPSPETARRRLLIEPGASGDPQINRIMDPEHSVVFVDVDGANSGKARPEEAEVASLIVQVLLKCGVPPREIGVITPYKAQQALIRGRLTDRGIGHHLLSVDTVDRFQGGEREVIILSLARSDGVTSFLADKKRLNVSLSRARSKLILLGHAASLSEHPLFQSLLEGLERVTVGSG